MHLCVADFTQTLADYAHLQSNHCLHLDIDSQQKTFVCIYPESLGPSVLIQTTVRISYNSAATGGLLRFMHGSGGGGVLSARINMWTSGVNVHGPSAYSVT